jgi:hypothetical protein
LNYDVSFTLKTIKTSKNEMSGLENCPAKMGKMGLKRCFRVKMMTLKIVWRGFSFDNLWIKHPIS